MKLKRIAIIQSGHLPRGKIEPHQDGSHFLLQARNVDGRRLFYKKDDLVKFYPALSKKDWILTKGDIVVMARGAKNYAALIAHIPKPALAAACFFIVRVSDEKLLPEYLCWYMNQTPTKHYFQRLSGRGVHMPVVRRSVLENIDIPLPNRKIQEKIVALEALRREEEDLIKRLAEKRKQLITASCLKLISGC